MQQNKQKRKDMTTGISLDRMAPQCHEAEKAVIGALLIQADAIHEVYSLLKKEYFYSEPLGEIFDVVKNIWENNGKPDMIRVSEELKKRQKLDEVGGPYGLAVLSGNVGTTSNIQEHAEFIHQSYLQRQLIRSAQEIIASASDPSIDVADAIGESLTKLENLAANMEYGNGAKHIGEAARKSLEDYAERERLRLEGKSVGITTGLRVLDKHLNGLQRKQLVIIGARPAMGKALRMDANILTPHGWKLNKDLKVGDEVCSIDGRPSFITGVFPQGFVKTYKVLFSDGREIECCGSHLWTVQSCKFHNKAERVVSTLELMELLTTERYTNRISIPLFSGITGKHVEFVIPPYLLGVLLGDGVFSKGVAWCKPDQFIVDKIKAMVDYEIRKRDDLYLITNTNDKYDNKYKRELEILGLWGKHSYDKFIPSIYLNCCRAQRIELLNGLLDTDGDIDKIGAICYNTVSEQLAKDVQTLCWSLGYKCSLKKRKSFLYGERKRDSYRLYIVSLHPEECFTLPRKVKRTKVRKSKPLTIVSVKPTGKYVECQCISVSHERALYITDDYIVTHNTALALHMAKYAALSGVPVVVFSLEMDASRLADRLILSSGDIQSIPYRGGWLTDSEKSIMFNAVGFVEQLPIYIDDSPNLTMKQIKARCINLQRKGKCGMVVIDYLGLLNMKADNNAYNREQEVTQASRQAKLMAKELDVPVVLLSQLNRNIESKMAGQKTTTVAVPGLSDLRESGAIEQDADVVLMIHRPEYYDNSADKGVGIINIAKQREGKTGKVEFCYNESLTVFYDRDDVQQEHGNPF